MRKLIPIILSLTFVLSLVSCGQNTAVNKEPSIRETETLQKTVVPNITGVSVEEAKQKLSEANLTPIIEYRYWVDKKGVEHGDYDNLETDGFVLKQDIPEGTVCAPYTIINLTVNRNENPFTYTKNGDGTITITKCVYGHPTDGKIAIPSVYEEQAVSAVTEDAINDLDDRLWDSDTKIFVPESIQVLGNPKMERVIRK